MDEIFCEDCNARFRNDCTCSIGLFNENPWSDKDDRWTGMDGHAYIGDKRYPSLAYHDTEHCHCPQGEKFDPESWY